jgi:DNA invertase Pin-like site-specific DNA recombinase
MVDRRIRRCAIYTRKSTEDGLEQAFNSLDAQREACAAYILSQASEGWESLPDYYDDGGFSGGSMKRPGLEQLLEDVASGKVDIIVVYKVDRLTRSLADFAKIVEVLDAHEASFVSVTQSFNTTNSMGRLTLNVLLSFAQFEREVTGERIRDKVAASKKKGMWMGGNVPMGYVVDERKLVVDREQADIVRHIYQRYRALQSVPALQFALREEGVRSPERLSRNGRKLGGNPLTKGAIYHILQNRIYVGDIMHQGNAYQGEHQPIIDRAQFEAVQRQLERNRVARKYGQNVKTPSLLAGIVFDAPGRRLTPSRTSRKGRLYRYYVSRQDSKQDMQHPAWRIPALDLEEIVLAQLTSLLTDQAALRGYLSDLDASDLQRCFDIAAALAGQINSASPSEIRQLLCGIVEQIVVHKDRIDTRIRLPAMSVDGVSDLFCKISTAAAVVSNGRQTRIMVSPNSANASIRKDPALIKLVAKAWAARQAMEASINDPKTTAENAGYETDYFARLVRIGYLAPDIIASIIEGRQPVSLTRQKLARLSSIPVDWNEQRTALGFNSLA